MQGKISSWKFHCDIVNHAVTPFIHTFLHGGLYQKESLVWFEASGLCHTINAGPSLGHFVDILLLPFVRDYVTTGPQNRCLLPLPLCFSK